MTSKMTRRAIDRISQLKSKLDNAVDEFDGYICVYSDLNDPCEDKIMKTLDNISKEVRNLKYLIHELQELEEMQERLEVGLSCRL